MVPNAVNISSMANARPLAAIKNPDRKTAQFDPNFIFLLTHDYKNTGTVLRTQMLANKCFKVNI